MMIKNNPNVSTVIGNESKTRMGFTMLFKNANVNVNNKAFQNPSIETPFKK